MIRVLSMLTLLLASAVPGLAHEPGLLGQLRQAEPLSEATNLTLRPQGSWEPTGESPTHRPPPTQGIDPLRPEGLRRGTEEGRWALAAASSVTIDCDWRAREGKKESPAASGGGHNSESRTVTRSGVDHEGFRLPLDSRVGIAKGSAENEKLVVVVTLPHLASVARAIGGELIRVEVLAAPGLDPHDIPTTPGQTKVLRQGRIFIENGLGLEGWATRLIETSGNGDLLPGGGGHVYASTGVRPVEVPTAAQIAAGGHVHAGGNPHVWLDPLNLQVAARNIEAALARRLYESAEELQKNLAAYERRIDEALYGKRLLKLFGAERLRRLHRSGRLMQTLREKQFRGAPLMEQAGGWVARAAKLEGMRIVSYHKTWSYFERAFGIEIVGTVEEKPGIPPGPAHLKSLASLAAEKAVRAVVSPVYYPENRVQAVAKQLDVPALILPTQPGEAGSGSDLLAMYDQIFDALQGAAGER